MIRIMGQKFKFLCKHVPGSKIVNQEIVSELMRKTRGAWRERRPTALPRSRPSYYRRVWHWLFCWFPSCIPTASCSQIMQDTSSSVYSPSPAAVFVSSRNAVGEERCVTRHNRCCENPPYKHLKLGYTLSECTFGIESDTCRNIHPNYKLGISGKSEFYVSDWSNSITHSFVSYIISAAMISWSRFYSWWLRS